jgi:anti-sigma factor RsiW
MSHPTREEWMAFVYEELEQNEKRPLTEHLQACPECARRVEAWRGTMGALDGWRISARSRPVTRQPWIRWAAAAAVLLAAGIAIGEVAASQRMRKEFAAESAQMRKEVLQAMSENRLQDQQAILATLRELETRRAGEMKALREDLETVAANTQVQLGRLVSFSGQ